jgi:Holliday junction resolvasome RuvABC endonuclease subunit
VVAIDPGYAVMGYSVWVGKDLERYGCLREKKGDKEPDAWQRRHNALLRLSHALEKELDFADDLVVEDVGYVRIQSETVIGTAKMVGHLEAYCSMWIDADFHAFPRPTWARGRDDKEVKAEMKLLTGDKKLGQDAADAIALGYWFVNRLEKDDAGKG